MLADAVKYLADLFPSAPNEESINHTLRVLKRRVPLPVHCDLIEFYMRVQRRMVRDGELREDQIRWHFIFLILLCMVPMYINGSDQINGNMVYDREYFAIMEIILRDGGEEAASERIVGGRRIRAHDLETLRLNWVPQNEGGRTMDAVQRYLAAASPQEKEDLIAIGVLVPPTEAEPEAETLVQGQGWRDRVRSWWRRRRRVRDDGRQDADGGE